ncbi:MAG TPA: hypothetical protein EYP89_01880, partial [Candidatus Omnitrophica bacterium]|nr:hypothetical protein [Candidatus Omnitrophota bacterium]
MSGQKQIIKRRIASIDKIVKITQAMEVVSLFRLKKVEKEFFKRKEYFEVEGVIASIMMLSVSFSSTLTLVHNRLLA